MAYLTWERRVRRIVRPLDLPPNKRRVPSNAAAAEATRSGRSVLRSMVD